MRRRHDAAPLPQPTTPLCASRPRKLTLALLHRFFETLATGYSEWCIGPRRRSTTQRQRIGTSSRTQRHIRCDATKFGLSTPPPLAFLLWLKNGTRCVCPAPYPDLPLQRAHFLVVTTTTNICHIAHMEPSDPTRVESYEMEAATPTHPSPTIAPEQATGRTRVRFNSSAAEIPPSPPRCSCSHISEAGSQQSDRDRQTPDVEDLLNAHNAEVDADSRYSVTGAAQGGVFYQLLQAYKTPAPQLNQTPSETSTASPARVLGSSSGAATPSRRKWYDVEKGTAVQSQETLATLIGASAKLANPNTKEDPAQTRPAHKRTASGGVLAKVWRSKEDKDARIKIHVANILKRQQYIIRMCRALMLFGAPTHRLEEYLAATAKVLEINSQFLYIPGCMIISFDDVLTQ
jgi:hypothetical protein